MKIKGISDEDFLQYKKPSMFVICPYCTFKCDKENGTQVCQNWSLAKAEVIDIDEETLIRRYLQNNITQAIVFGGLEPLDSFEQVLSFIENLRINHKCDDDVVIYTGYRNDEIEDKISLLSQYKNIIIKFGRYIPNQKPHFDPVLGIELASNNQYRVKLS